MKPLLSLLWPFARLVPLHGSFLAMQRQWQYNQAWRHVLCEGAVAWGAAGAAAWQIGRALELAGRADVALVAILGMAALWSGAAAMLLVFGLLALPFNLPED